MAIHPQVGKATRPRPVGQLGVNPFAVHHQWRKQTDVLAAKLRHQLRNDALQRLRRHRCAVMHAVLCAQFDKQQAQKMPDLGGGADGGFATAPAQALLDRHGGWYAIHRIHLGPAGRLHDGTGVGVEAFEVTALAFVEQDVKCQCRLA
jgi:hypothetical protein